MSKWANGEAILKDWLDGYSWIPYFFREHHNQPGNLSNLMSWMSRQRTEKPVLGLRNSLVSLLANVKFYGKTLAGQTLLVDMPQSDMSIIPLWKACNARGIHTIEDIEPHIDQAIYILDNLWHTIQFSYQAINKRQISLGGDFRRRYVNDGTGQQIPESYQ